MQQEQDAQPGQSEPAEYQIADTADMTIPQWERVKAQYAAAGYQYAAGLVVFRRMATMGHAEMLSVVPPADAAT